LPEITVSQLSLDRSSVPAIIHAVSEGTTMKAFEELFELATHLEAAAETGNAEDIEHPLKALQMPQLKWVEPFLDRGLAIIRASITKVLRRRDPVQISAKNGVSVTRRGPVVAGVNTVTPT
jgi:hypothetical protein